MLLAVLVWLVTFAPGNSTASVSSGNISSVSPLIAALTKKSHDPSSPANNRLVPRASQMGSLSSKPETSTITTYDPAKLPNYDYAEPEEIRNKLEEELVRKSFSTNYEKQLVTNFQQKMVKPSNSDVNEIINGRRKGNSIEFYMRPKHEDKKIDKKTKRNHFKSKKHNKYQHLHKSGLTYISTGLTTPSKYEIKRYKKPRKHKRHRNHHEHRRPFSKIGVRRENDINSRHHQSRYVVERRQDFKLQPIDAPLNSLEFTMPADLASELILQPSEVRVHSHPPHSLDSTLSVATRPTNYEVATNATTKPLLELVWHSEQPTNQLLGHSEQPTNQMPTAPTPTEPTPTTPMPTQPTPTKQEPTKRVHEHRTHKKKHVSHKGFDRGYSKKQKHLESRIANYIHKNQNALREFAKYKKEKMPAILREEKIDKAVFRFGNVITTKLPFNALQLDLSPGKSHKMEVMRRKGRICQRNVMIPEGPKYNSLGQTYMPEFKRSPGGPDYANTKEPSFLIPACCNCCKKSVLGCQ